MNREEIIKYLSKNLNISEKTLNELSVEILEYYKDPKVFIKMLSNFIEDFDEAVNKVDNYYGSRRKRFIDNKLSSTYFYYNYNHPDNDFINDLVLALKPRLKDQIQYWKKEIDMLPAGNDKFKKLDAQFKLQEIQNDFKIFFESKRDNTIHKPTFKKGGKTLSKTDSFVSKPQIVHVLDDSKLNNLHNRIQYLIDHLSIEEKNKFYSELVYDSQKLNERLYKKDDINFINGYVNRIEKLLQISKTEVSSDTERKFDRECPSIKTIAFNPNEFNQAGAELFEYLVQKYIDIHKKYGQMRRFTNVWYFMKNDISEKNKYKIYLTMKNYIVFVKNNFGLVIKNTNKATQKYDEEKVKLQDHVIEFESKIVNKINPKKL